MAGSLHMARASLPSRFGDFTISVYQRDDNECVMLQCGDPGTDQVLVRFHSECLTGDVLGSLRCDCRQQLLSSLELIAQEGAGYFFYLRQEGRGIGLFNKIRAYHLQDQGRDTIQANLELGLPVDARKYDFPLDILRTLNVKSVRLITNNPDKIAACETAGLMVSDRVYVESTVNPHNEGYLHVKRALLHHFETDEPSRLG